MDCAGFTELVLNTILSGPFDLLIDRDEAVRRNMQNILDATVFNDEIVEGNIEDSGQVGEWQTTITPERRHSIGRRLPIACMESDSSQHSN